GHRDLRRRGEPHAACPPQAAPETGSGEQAALSTMELTIGMATYRDFHGGYFTLQALRLYQDLRGTGIIVVANFACPPRRNFVEQWAQARYILAPDLPGAAAAKDRVFQEARGRAVLCLDCHVLLPRPVIARLKRYYRDHPRCRDLLQGPLLYDDLTTLASH